MKENMKSLSFGNSLDSKQLEDCNSTEVVMKMRREIDKLYETYKEAFIVGENNDLIKSDNPFEWFDLEGLDMPILIGSYDSLLDLFIKRMRHFNINAKFFNTVVDINSSVLVGDKTEQYYHEHLFSKYRDPRQDYRKFSKVFKGTKLAEHICDNICKGKLPEYILLDELDAFSIEYVRMLWYKHSDTVVKHYQALSDDKKNIWKSEDDFVEHFIDKYMEYFKNILFAFIQNGIDDNKVKAINALFRHLKNGEFMTDGDLIHDYFYVNLTETDEEFYVLSSIMTKSNHEAETLYVDVLYTKPMYDEIDRFKDTDEGISDYFKSLFILFSRMLDACDEGFIMSDEALDFRCDYYVENSNDSSLDPFSFLYPHMVRKSELDKLPDMIKDYPKIPMSELKFDLTTARTLAKCFEADPSDFLWTAHAIDKIDDHYGAYIERVVRGVNENKEEPFVDIDWVYNFNEDLNKTYKPLVERNIKRLK